jgi:hypothetical protein
VTRLALLLSLVVLALACSSAPDAPPVASVEQALDYCGTPGYVHKITNVRSVTVRAGSAAWCPAAYYSNEPQIWSLGLNAAPPKLPNGTQCTWLSAGLCYNSVTFEGPSVDACYNGACYYYRAFSCPNGVTYSMNPVWTWNANWQNTIVTLIATEPGCNRKVSADFLIMLPAP